MTKLAIIGGTGLTTMPGLTVERRQMVKTDFGVPSAPLVHGQLNGVEVIFLPRHGGRHTIPPHAVNYRANIMALKTLGITRTIAVAAVGGIADECTDSVIVVPDQIIDYTYGRLHTFHEEKAASFEHIEFTNPYSEVVRQQIIDGARVAGVDCIERGVYGVTQGPRLETAAEIARLERDGCTLVGMTGMPEAALAREAGLEYGCCAMVVNRAAGKGSGDISFADIEANLTRTIDSVQAILVAAVAANST